MPVNWNEFERDINSIIEAGAKKADDRLASRISSVTRMTDAEVKKLFPKPADVQTLAKLIRIVKSAEKRNTKINNLVANAREFGGVALTLLEKFA